MWRLTEYDNSRYNDQQIQCEFSTQPPAGQARQIERELNHSLAWPEKVIDILLCSGQANEGKNTRRRRWFIRFDLDELELVQPTADFYLNIERVMMASSEHIIVHFN